jgi:hypothetical protein
MENYARISKDGAIVMTIPERTPGEEEDLDKKIARAQLLDEQHIALTSRWKKESERATGTVQQFAPGEIATPVEDAASTALVQAFSPDDEHAKAAIEEYDISMLRAIVFEEQLKPELLYQAEEGTIPPIQLDRRTATELLRDMRATSLQATVQMTAETTEEQAQFWHAQETLKSMAKKAKALEDFFTETIPAFIQSPEMQVMPVHLRGLLLKNVDTLLPPHDRQTFDTFVQAVADARIQNPQNAPDISAFVTHLTTNEQFRALPPQTQEELRTTLERIAQGDLSKDLLLGAITTEEVREQTKAIDTIYFDLLPLVQGIKTGMIQPKALQERISVIKTDERFKKLLPDARLWLTEQLRRVTPTIEQIKIAPPQDAKTAKTRSTAVTEFRNQISSLEKLESVDHETVHALAEDIWKNQSFADLALADKLSALRSLLPHEPFKSRPELITACVPDSKELDTALRSLQEITLPSEIEKLVDALYREVKKAKEEKAREEAYKKIRGDERFKTLDATARIALYEQLRRDNLTPADETEALALLRRRRLLVEVPADGKIEVYRQRKGHRTENLTENLLPKKPTSGDRKSRPKMTTLDLEPEDRIYLLQQELDPLSDEPKDLSREIDTVASSTVAEAADLTKRLSEHRTNAVVLRVPKTG